MATCNAYSGSAHTAMGQPGAPAEPPAAPQAQVAPQPRESGSPADAAVMLLSLIGGAWLGFMDYDLNGGALRALGAAGLGFVFTMAVLHVAVRVLALVFRILKVGVQIALLGAAVLTVGNIMDLEWAATATTHVYGFLETVGTWAEPVLDPLDPGLGLTQEGPG